MQLAFIKLMNNRFTHSQEYVEYCQIIIIIILMIENILSATVCQEHFTSMTKEDHPAVSLMYFTDKNISENNPGVQAIDAHYCIYM